MDDDAIAEKTGWVASDDGLLFHDTNNNDVVNTDELFGNDTFTGFTKLAKKVANDNNNLPINHNHSRARRFFIVANKLAA